MATAYQNAKILIVEDETTMAFLLKKLLNDMNYEVCDIVASGEKALLAVDEHRPDLVLMDINLEGDMDGIEAAEIILSTYGVPVIYATADGEEDTINQASTTTPLGYVIKPYNKKSLKSTLVVALSILEFENKKSRELKTAYNTISYQKQELIESFKSAKEIQRAILPTEADFKKYFPESFILNKPKESLGGDFFWYRELGNGKIIFGVIDCTGHGIPGALMSVLVNYQLNISVNKLGIDNNIGDLLNSVDRVLSDYATSKLAETEEERRINEITNLNSGFDGAFCTYDFNTKSLHFCGAKRPLYIFRDGDLLEFKGNRSSVGLYSIAGKKFTEEQIKIRTGDQIYMFSDGFSDQMGGPKGKRFLSRRLKIALKDTLHLSAQEQSAALNKIYLDWKGTEEDQLDDILVMGLKINA